MKAKIKGKSVEVDPRTVSITIPGNVGARSAPSNRREPRYNVKENPRTRKMKLEGQEKWDHNAFDKIEYRERKNPVKSSPRGTKVLISNLDHGVTSDDIRDLFKAIGPLVSYGVHYDESNRSKGTADVIFKNDLDAKKATQEFNGLLLDNMPLELKVMEHSNNDLRNRLKQGPSFSKSRVVEFGTGTNNSFHRAVKAVRHQGNTRGTKGRGSKPVAMDE